MTTTLILLAVAFLVGYVLPAPAWAKAIAQAALSLYSRFKR